MREPIVHSFSEGEFRVLRLANHKKNGHHIRGPMNITIARRLKDMGMIAIEEDQRPLDNFRKGGGRTNGGILATITHAGREALSNAGLIAAGRLPTTLE